MCSWEDVSSASSSPPSWSHLWWQSDLNETNRWTWFQSMLFRSMCVNNWVAHSRGNSPEAKTGYQWGAGITGRKFSRDLSYFCTSYKEFTVIYSELFFLKMFVESFRRYIIPPKRKEKTCLLSNMKITFPSGAKDSHAYFLLQNIRVLIRVSLLYHNPQHVQLIFIPLNITR